MIKGAVFIDANIIIHAASFRQADVFEWINALYETVYIHIEVVNEIKTSSVKEKIETFLKDDVWILFDPESEESIASDDLYELYLTFFHEIRVGFQKLDEKKIREGRPLKFTSDLGEMHSLAAAKLINAGIICSDDADIREVIHDEEIYIYDAIKGETLILQHTLSDFCALLNRHEVVKRSDVRKFFKAIRPKDIALLDKQLDESGAK